MRGTVDEWLRARSTVRSLGRTKQRPKNPNAYPWLVNGATTPEQLQRHRAALERDCFASKAHRETMQEAARAYDAAVQREKESRKPGRPKKFKPLIVDRRKVA